jgi:hypothetical protein
MMLKNNEIRILGILVRARQNNSFKVQELLTKYGCCIKTRLGLHDVQGNECSPNGLILLELAGDKGEMDKLENELLTFDGIEVKKMIFR